MSLVQPLPPGALDIVGDIHGEYAALVQLLGHLGYDLQGNHPEGRRLVFVGDFCDRGPDSPSVLALVGAMLASGTAHAVLGNHEINLLREDAKDGSGWFFDSRIDSDQPKYAPFARMPAEQTPAMLEQLGQLPIALEREDLRIVHAAWRPEQIAMIRQLPSGSARAAYDHFETIADEQAIAQCVAERMRQEALSLALQPGRLSPRAAVSARPQRERTQQGHGQPSEGADGRRGTRMPQSLLCGRQMALCRARGLVE